MKVFVSGHPLVQHKLSILRRRYTGTKEFRELVEELAMLVGYEATRDMELEEIKIETPVATTMARRLRGRTPVVVPILRAGLGMVEGFFKLIPDAKVGHIGLQRDEETLEPIEYYAKMPNYIEERSVFVVDPMLATGGSAAAAITKLKERGAKDIRLVCLVAAPEGVHLINEAHPDVDIYTAALDDHLNERGYIVPGLGDAGDRIFGTLK